jgi:hypothetical protein
MTYIANCITPLSQSRATTKGFDISTLFCMALIIESIERRFLERDLAMLGEGFAINEEIRRERDYFELLLKQNGIDPFGLPSIPQVH